jgi:predicted nucleic acid-binding protein
LITLCFPDVYLCGFNLYLFRRKSLHTVGAREPMSFDLGVWYPDKRISNEEAGKLYERLCDSDTRGVVANPAVDRFYAELTAKHPEIDKVPEAKINDLDCSPWSCKLDHSPGHVILSCVWPKATDVHKTVQNLARKHGLAIYDPQSDVISYPDGSTGTKANRGALWILSFFGALFAAIFVYVGQISPSGSPVVFYYAFAGLCVLMAVACFRQTRR